MTGNEKRNRKLIGSVVPNTKLAACCAGFLFATTAAISTAEARPRAPFLTSIDVACMGIVHEGSRLVREYKTANSARRQEILTQLGTLGRNWNAAGCRAIYGNLGTRLSLRAPATMQTVQPDRAVTRYNYRR